MKAYQPKDDNIRREFVEVTGVSEKEARKWNVAEMIERLAEEGVEWAVAVTEEYERNHQ